MQPLKELIVSKVRVSMFELFYSNPEEMYYVRQITRLINEEINAVRRELERLLGAGMLKSEKRGNRLYYYLNKKFVFHQDLLQIVAKTTGLGQQIRKKRRKLGKLEFVMFSGKFIRQQTPDRDEVDLLVIGDVVLPELQALIKKEEEKIEREINYAVFSLEEFNFRKTRRDPFIMNILYSSRVMIIGNEVEFAHRSTPGIDD